MTDAEKLQKLIEAIERVVPYVVPSIDPKGGNTFQSKERPDWVEVHGGRAGSSTAQLNNLLKMAQEFKSGV